MSNDLEIDEELTLEIKNIAKKLGADKVGIAMTEKAENLGRGNVNPSDIIADARSAIVIALKIPDGIVDSKHEDFLIHGSYVNITRAISGELAQIGYKISRFLERIGYDAAPITPDLPREESMTRFVEILDHKYLGQLAGLGEIGISNLFLTPEWGPRVMLTSIITDAPLKEDGPIYVDKVCTKCFKCVNACPTRAIASDNYPPFNFNLNRCMWATQGWYRLTKVQEPPEDWVNAKPNAKIVIPKYQVKYPQIKDFQEWALKLGDFPQCITCMQVCPVGLEGHQKRIDIVD